MTVNEAVQDVLDAGGKTSEFLSNGKYPNLCPESTAWILQLSKSYPELICRIYIC